MQTISALCVSGRSIYKHLPGVEAYDEARDARTFQFDTPVIAHPPCRCWSKYLRHQAKPKDRQREMELGLFCGRAVFHCGGVLEQPAGSYLIKEIIERTQSVRSDFCVIELNQSLFGYANRKRTWLILCGVWLRDLPGYQSAGPAKAPARSLSKAGRSRTMPAFADWLCQTARLTKPAAVPLSQAGQTGRRAKSLVLPFSLVEL